MEGGFERNFADVDTGKLELIQRSSEGVPVNPGSILSKSWNFRSAKFMPTAGRASRIPESWRRRSCHRQ